MYAYMELIKDSTECLQDSSLVNIDVRDRNVTVEEEREINKFIKLRLKLNDK